MSNENANQAADQVSEQAFWTIPGSTTTVTYSLPLFHDIDFVVNEGYRKIPHGGIEVGGLLFGTIDENGTGIAAFRPIECEHVFGPSLLLSERDLKGVESQIAALASDPDLQGMQLVGWFLAHTRGPLQLTDPELELCDRFFKSPGQLTVLVKPERFQPTLFGFLVRDASGNMGRDASQHAVILPLPGRAGRSDEGAGPVPALKSPKSSSVPRRSARSAQSPVSEPSGSDSEAARPPTGDREAPASPARDATESAMTDAIRSARRRLKFEEARLLAEREEAQAAAPQARPVKPAAAEIGEATEAEPDRLSDLAAALPGASASLKSKPSEPSAPLYQQLKDTARETPVPHYSRLLLVLALAAVFGCVVGYIAYLQIPPPVIPLNARSLPQSVLVSWPPSETRKAVYAAIRVDDSAPVPLSPEEKAAGELELSATGDMKVELITRNWMRDSRGIVRFVKASSNPANAVAP